MPAAYVGTCGVILGGGYVGSTPVPESPVSANDAGQLVVETGC
jgi:hypothetical protein